jgi:hypothetical protein
MGTKILGTVLAALILAASAYADAIFTPGNHPQPDEENIHFTHQTGPAVFGTTDVSGTMVDYLATTNLNAHGVNIDGPIVNITIKVPGHDFEDYIVNAFNGGVPPDVVITTFMNDGKSFSSPMFGGHGNNFMTVTAGAGEDIVSITITSPKGFASLDQNRISGISVIPEPSSMLLLGGGLLGVAGVLRRKLRQ